MKTDQFGMVSAPVSGRGAYIVSVRKDGYEEFTDESPVFCPIGSNCDACNPSLRLTMNPKFCNLTVKMNIQVLNSNGGPVDNAAVSLILTSSIAGSSAANVGGELHTNADGSVSPMVYESGTYMVTVTASGYLAKSVEAIVEESTACEDLFIPLAITLDVPDVDVTTIPPVCENTTMVVTVMDFVTNTPIQGATVDIKSGVNIETINLF